MADTVLLTGISGFLGSHIALQLLQAGFKVRGSVRDLNRADEVRDTMTKHGANADMLEFVALDLLKDQGWDEAMLGVKYLQHTASPFVIQEPKDEMELIRPAVEGTKRAISAALKSKVEHIVLTSSFAAIGYGHSPNLSSYSEKNWTKVDGPNVTAYTKSKTLAEQAAWELMEAAERKTDLSTINPTFILGPLLNQDPGTSGTLLTRFLDGSLPGTPRLNFPCIDVRDVAELHVKAMTNEGAAGKRHLMAHSSLSMFELGQALKAQLPSYASKLPKFEMPNWAVKIYAIFDADARGALSELGVEKIADASRAKDLLGREFISSEKAAAAMGQSLVDQGLV